MARRFRIKYPDACYHITARGNEGRTIYLCDKDRIRFLEMLGNAVEDYELVLHAHSLMLNHYHLEVQTPLANLSEAMQWLNSSYAGYFNAAHVRSGHLFQGRYHSVLVDKDAYLKQLTRYIHVNSVRAGLVARPEDYRWSSYRAYLGLDRQPEWLETGWTLAQFGRRLAEARRRYRRFVEEGLREGAPNPLEDIVAGAVLGSEQFVDRVKTRVGDLPDGGDLSVVRSLRDKVSMERIVEVVSKAMDIEESRVLSKGRHSNLARRIAIYLCRKYSGEKLSGIAVKFGGVTEASVSAISREMERLILADASLPEKLRVLGEKLNLKV